MPDVLVVEQVTILAEQPESTVLVEEVEVTQVISDAVQGPPGPAGPGGSISFSSVTGQAVGGHRAVIQTAAGLLYADAGDVTHAGRVAGITTAAAGMGESVSFQAAGKITEPSWTWVDGGDIWLGLDGQLTQIFSPSVAFVQRLGYAIGATAMWVELSEPVITD